jgi:hypothetical protein
LSQTLSDGYAVAAIVCVDGRAQCLRHSAESDAGRTVDLGNANVSLPVREYPALPILQEHSARAT